MSRTYAYQRVLASVENPTHPDVAAMLAKVHADSTGFSPPPGRSETIDAVWLTSLKMIASGEASDPRALAAAAESAR